MRVAVLGGAGYVGGIVVEELKQSGHHVVVIDNLMYTDFYGREDVDFYRLDITTHAFSKFLDRNRFDAIILLSAIVGDGACQYDPSLAINVNENAVRKISQYVKKNCPKTKIIFASTCSTFGANDTLLDESSKTNPLSVYASTKLNAEKYIIECPNHVIFRLGTLFGLSHPLSGRLRTDLVVNVLTIKACEGKTISVFGGEQYRPILHVKDAGRVFAESISATYTGLYIVSMANYKIVDIAKRIIDIVPSSGDIEITPNRFEDFRNYMVNTERAISVGINVKHTLDDGIKELMELIYSGRVKNPWISKYNNMKFLNGGA